MEVEAVAGEIVDSIVKVHRPLGPGLLESAYQKCLAHELAKRGVRVECEVMMPVMFHGIQIDAGYRVDMVVEGCVIVENKCARKLDDVHEASCSPT